MAHRESFAGVRVVELAGCGIAGAYAGWLLAKVGAQVTRLGAAPAVRDAGNPIQLALEALAAGKLHRESPTDAASLESLLTNCDVVITDSPATIRALFGSIDAIGVRWPRVIVGVASIFGVDGPHADAPGAALDAQALSAVAWALGEPGREPLSFPPGVLEHQAGAMLAAGCAMGLLTRDRVAPGIVVDVALADVLASYVAGNCRVYIHHNLRWHRSGRRASGSAGAYPYVVLPCSDGQVCICGRTRDEWERFVKAMGSPAWAAEPRYQKLRAMGTQYPDEVDALVMPWLAGKTMQELEAIALENNLIVSPLRGFDDVLATPHFAQRGFFSKATVAGKPVMVPGLGFRVVERRSEAAADIASSLLSVLPEARMPAASVPATATAPAATSGAATSSAPSAATSAAARVVAPTHAAPLADGPLRGMRVLDFGWVWSAPWTGTMLAELGAEVIKVEHAMRPDNLRLSGRVYRNGQQVEGPTTEMSPMFHQVNHGKLGITLNAKRAEAVAILQRLAATCDLVIENMSPGSMDRSGLGYDVLRKNNPALVMLSMAAAGQFGELSTMRTYAPIMSSFVGLERLVGYPGEPPIGALNVGLGDPNASVHGLFAVLAALLRARATGQGCLIDFSQNESLLTTLLPYLLQHQVTGHVPPTVGNRHPDMAPHGIYPAAGDDAWLTIAVANDTQWNALAALASDAGFAHDARFATNAGRLAHVDDLDRAIAEWTSTQPRDQLSARLRDTGIASSPVLSIEEAWAHPHYAARGIKSPVDIPVLGPEDVFRGPWKFSRFEPRITRRGPSMGEHNQYVFGDILGMSSDEIDRLQQAGVIA